MDAANVKLLASQLAKPHVQWATKVAKTRISNDEAVTDVAAYYL